MCAVTEEFLKEALHEYLAREDFSQETIFEFDHYDGTTEQIFLQIEGKWDIKTSKKLTEFFKVFNKRLLVARIKHAEPKKQL